MTTWALGDYPQMAQRLRTVAVAAVAQAGVTSADRVVDVSPYLPPPPPATGPPSRWGDADALGDLLRAAGLHLANSVVGQLVLDFPDPAACTDFLVPTAGHVMAEQEELTRADRWNDLNTDLQAYITERGHKTDGYFRLPLDYLLTTATKAR